MATVAAPAAPLRIAVLMADVPVPSVQARDGDYGDVFETLFKKASRQLGVPDSALAWSKYDVVTKMEYPREEDVDAILITGSRHNAFDDDAWIVRLTEYTRAVLEAGRVRVVGVCFGHQILGRALGAPVRRNDSWEVSVCGVELTARGKELFGKEKLMHRDIVADLPAGAEPLGSSPTCAVQGLYRPGHYISVQGHPEFTGPIVTEIIDSRILSSVFTEAEAEEYKARAGNAHDGVGIAAAFIQFLQE